jgi:TPR repeat protein
MTMSPKLETYRQRAKGGDPDAQISLAWEYFLGEEVPKDFTEAIRLLREAEQRKPEVARFYLAKAKLLEGDNSFADVNRNDCSYGFGPALYLMGAARDRTPSAEDKHEALAYFERAAAADHLVAKYFVWRMNSLVWRLITLPYAICLVLRIAIAKFRNPHDVRVLI